MSQTLSPSLARGYGMSRVTRVWKISRASVYRSLKEMPPNTIARRPGPVGACSDAELAEHIRQHIAASRLHGEGYRKLWARLRFAGVRTSARRVRRVMRENGLLAPHRVGRTETRPHDGTIITDKVNEMWGTDMTQCSDAAVASRRSSAVPPPNTVSPLATPPEGTSSENDRSFGSTAKLEASPRCHRWPAPDIVAEITLN